MPSKDEVSKENIKNQKDLNSEVEKNLSFEEEILFILNKRRGIDGETLKDQQDINNVLADQTKQLKFQIAEKNIIKSLSSKISKIASATYNINREELGTKKTLNTLTKTQLDLDKSIQSLTHQQNKLFESGGRLNVDIANSIGMQVEEAVKLKKEITKVQEESGKVSKSFGKRAFGGLSDVVKSIPGLKGLSGPFEEASEAAREQAQSNLENFGTTKKVSLADQKATNAKLTNYKKLRKEGLNIGDSLKKAGVSAKQVKIGKLPGIKSISPLKAGFKSLGPVIAKALGPLALIGMAVKAIKFFVDAMFDASKATAEMSRNMLVSRDSARELYETTNQQALLFNEISKEQGNQTILTEDYRKAIGTINSQLGVQLQLATGFGQQTTDNVLEVARMQKLFGLSAEATTQLFMESVKTGTSLQDNNKELFGNLQLMSNQSGIQVDMNKTIEEAAKIQGNLRANFKGSTDNIAQAVFQAKLLGLNLSQVAGAGEKLLDFESSIGAEMEAELLIGRQLNLEKAREYALMGNTKGLMEEISKQAGTQEDFLKMNIIQRKALANAVGMEVNELADMYSKKAKNDKLAEKSLKLQNKLEKEGIVIRKDADGNILNSMADIEAASRATGKSEKEIRDILGGQVYLRKQEEDSTQKFNKALGQAKEAFANLVDGGLLDKLIAGLTGLVESSIFSGYVAEGEALSIQKETEKERLKALKSAGITEKTDKETGLVSVTVDESALEGKTDIQKEAIKAEIERTESNASLAEEALEAQAQATGVDDVVDVGAAALSGAALGAGLTAWLGPGAAIGAALGGLIGGGLAIWKNVEDQETADEALAEVRKINADGEELVDDFILRPGKQPIKFNKDDLLIGGTNLGGSGSNNEVAILLKELLSTVKKGGNVYMDGALVGSATTLAYNKL